MTTDPKREALAAEAKRLVSEYAEAWLARGEGAKVDTASPLVALHAAIDALAQPPEGEGRAESPHRWMFTDEHGLEGISTVPPSIWNARSRNSRTNVTPLYLTAPSAGHGEGWVSVPKVMLEDWKERVNTISVLTLKDDRWKYGRALKQDITHVLNNGPTPKDNRHE